MKIVFDRSDRHRGGEILAVSHLESLVNSIANLTNDPVLRVWQLCLKQIADEAVASNYQRRDMKLEFDFDMETIIEGITK